MCAARTPQLITTCLTSSTCLWRSSAVFLTHCIWCVLCRDVVPLGKVRGGFNFNLEDKRVLNYENIVNDSDNIKQDISIDVYGRKDTEAEEAAARKAAIMTPCEAAAKLEEEEQLDAEDELDALLAG